MTSPTDSLLSKMREETDSLTFEEKTLDKLSVITSVVLFIITIPGAAGLFAGSTMGGLAIGLGGAGLGFHLIIGKFKERKISLLTGILRTLAPVLIGSLGVLGILSGAHVACGVMVMFLAFLICYAYLAIDDKRSTIEKTIDYVARPIK